MRIRDGDDANEVKMEERQYEQWQWKEKNRILNMTNTQRKQEEWSKVFPPLSPPDDSYLFNNVIY